MLHPFSPLAVTFISLHDRFDPKSLTSRKKFREHSSHAPEWSSRNTKTKTKNRSPAVIHSVFGFQPTENTSQVTDTPSVVFVEMERNQPCSVFQCFTQFKNYTYLVRFLSKQVMRA